MSNKQYEGSTTPGQKQGVKVTDGTMTPKLRKASVTPSPSDKGNFGRGKG